MNGKEALSYCRFRLAQLGRAGVPSIVLVFIGLLLIDCLMKKLKSDFANNQEGKPMKIKMKRIITRTVMATLKIVWDVGTDFLYETLLA